MIQYKIINSHVDNEIGKYDSFGISVLNNGLLIKNFDDLTSDYEEISNLVALCNEEQVELVHIDDIIENFLLC